MSGLIRDDFAGAGGWSEGLAMLGLHDVGVEFEANAVATARAAGHERIHADVTSSEIRDRDWGRIEGYIASPPCQTFSAAGKGQGRKHIDSLIEALGLVADGSMPEQAVALVSDEALDFRSVLVLEPMLVIRDHQPTWIAFEQVPTVLPIWEAYAEVLRGQGYHMATGILNAEQYGVPQTRRRAVLVAHRDHEVSLPAPTHSRYHSRSPLKLDDDVLPWVSMAEALSWGLSDRPAPTVTGGGTETGGAEPIAHLSRYPSRPGWVPRAAVPGDTSWAYRRPSPTIVGTFAPDVVAAPGYRKPGDGPRQKQPGSVRVTVQEAAVLQSFRPDHPWQGSKTAQYLQVGNAVPPLMAAHVISAVTGIPMPTTQREELAA